MSKIELLLLIVFLLLLILLFKYLQTKRQIRNLSKQIAELVNGKSEKMLDISLIDKDLEQLAGILNQYNDNQRQLIARDRKSTRLNSSHPPESRMPSSA